MNYKIKVNVRQSRIIKEHLLKNCYHYGSGMHPIDMYMKYIYIYDSGLVGDKFFVTSSDCVTFKKNEFRQIEAKGYIADFVKKGSRRPSTLTVISMAIVFGIIMAGTLSVLLKLIL